MDWKSEAIQKLNEYELKKVSKENLAAEILEIQYKRRSVRSAVSDGMPVTNGTNKREDMLLNSLVLQKELIH